MGWAALGAMEGESRELSGARVVRGRAGRDGMPLEEVRDELCTLTAGQSAHRNAIA